MSDQKFVIKGGTPLNGELKIQGAKNSVLPDNRRFSNVRRRNCNRELSEYRIPMLLQEYLLI